VLWATRLRL